MWAVSWVIKGLPPFERDFDRDDPLIDHKHRDNQQVTWFRCSALSNNYEQN